MPEKERPKSYDEAKSILELEMAGWETNFDEESIKRGFEAARSCLALFTDTFHEGASQKRISQRDLAINEDSILKSLASEKDPEKRQATLTRAKLGLTRAFQQLLPPDKR